MVEWFECYGMWSILTATVVHIVCGTCRLSMKVGDMVWGYVPIKWQEDIREEDVVFPGLKATTGMIVDKNNRDKKILVLIDGATVWWKSSSAELINE
jgi:hypothetical protein